MGKQQRPQSSRPLNRPLTDRQLRVLVFIEECVALRSYPPTYREIGAWLGIQSPNGVKCHIDALKKKGYISCEKGKSRTIQIIEE